LTAEEYGDLRTDFENLAATIPIDVTISGEQISGGALATVFVQIKDVDAKLTQAEPVALFREGNAWIIGDRASANLIKQEGKDFSLTCALKPTRMRRAGCCSASSWPRSFMRRSTKARSQIFRHSSPPDFAEGCRSDGIHRLRFSTTACGGRTRFHGLRDTGAL
jgi:hypothetical protein